MVRASPKSLMLAASALVSLVSLAMGIKGREVRKIISKRAEAAAMAAKASNVTAQALNMTGEDAPLTLEERMLEIKPRRGNKLTPTEFAALAAATGTGPPVLFSNGSSATPTRSATPVGAVLLKQPSIRFGTATPEAASVSSIAGPHKAQSSAAEEREKVGDLDFYKDRDRIKEEFQNYSKLMDGPDWRSHLTVNTILGPGLWKELGGRLAAPSPRHLFVSATQNTEEWFVKCDDMLSPMMSAPHTWKAPQEEATPVKAVRTGKTKGLCVLIGNEVIYLSGNGVWVKGAPCATYPNTGDMNWTTDMMCL